MKHSLRASALLSCHKQQRMLVLLCIQKHDHPLADRTEADLLQPQGKSLSEQDSPLVNAMLETKKAQLCPFSCSVCCKVQDIQTLWRP